MILLAGKFISGIHIGGFWWALVFGVLLSFISSAITKSSGKKK
jgi:putative membrane protein